MISTLFEKGAPGRRALSWPRERDDAERPVNAVRERAPRPLSSDPPQPPSESPGFSDESRAGPGTDLVERWPAFLSQFRQERPNLSMFLSHGHIAAFHGSTMDLRFAPTFKFQFSEVTRPQNREIILKKLAAFAGGQVDLHMTLETTVPEEAPKNYLAHMGADGTLSIEDDIRNEPIIKTVLDVFDGEVLD